MRRSLLLISLLAAPGLLAAHAGYQSFALEGRVNGLLSLFGAEEKIEAWFFDASSHRLVVLDEGDAGENYGSLDRAVDAGGCVAGINGGYFSADEARSPLGLVLHGGKLVAPLATKGFTVSGALYDTGRTVKLERSGRLSTPVSKMAEAIQGGPFLVENGKVVGGLNATRRARRSFVATDGQGHWCLGVTGALSLDELGRLLASGRALGDFRVQTALNMDGGSSSAFWSGQPHVYRMNTKPVRNYIGVAPRPPERREGGKKPSRRR